jgi:hypothetical protein
VSDGLSQLTQQREKHRKRSIPPPRNAPRTAPVSAAADDDEAEPTERPPDVVATPKPTSTATGTAENLAKFSIYFDTDNDEFLESVRAAGRRSQPRVDSSRSAVARLAVARLAEQMTPEEVVAELQLRAPKTPGNGRRRL